ncbi:TPA: hypothetical protein QEM96_001898 [Pseudomonas putida]|nr:hypothetical protein [Pseudomonas putida]
MPGANPERVQCQPLLLQELASQLGMNLRAALEKIEQLESARATGPEAQYQEGSRLGAGGTN